MRFTSLLLSAVSVYAGATLFRQENALNLTKWDRGHEVDAHQMLQISIAFKVQNVELGVETLLRISDPTSSDYGRHLSAQDVARMFEPSLTAVSEVTDWLKDSDIDESDFHFSYGGGHLSLELPAGKASFLLGTTFHHGIHRETGERHIACQSYYIPESVAGSIDYILSGSQLSTHRHFSRQQTVLDDRISALAPLPSNCLQQTGLSCLRSLYKIPENVIPHPNNSFGVFEPSYYSWLSEDLDEFFGKLQKNLVGHRPKVDAVNGGYLQRNYTGLHWNQESNLEFEYTMALTSPQEVTNVQVGSDKQVGNLNDMLSAFDKYYCNSTTSAQQKYPHSYPSGCNATACDCGSSIPPKVLSISYGWTEAGFTPSYLHRQCLEFLKLGLMGTTVVVSVSDHGTASDGGSFCIDDKSGNATDGRFSPTFPSTCSWVTSVGGTQMLRSTDPQIPVTAETAFRKVISGTLASSGGGFSNVFSVPSYQVPNVARYKETEKDHLNKLQDCFNSTGRGYPDVAVRADDYVIVSNGQWRLTSGTSASNPVFASIITLINSERMHAGKRPVGFINPVLYSNPAALNDVVRGANQGCGVDQAFRATSGWDAVTGLGSPDYERLRDLFLTLP